METIRIVTLGISLVFMGISIYFLFKLNNLHKQHKIVMEVFDKMGDQLKECERGNITPQQLRYRLIQLRERYPKAITVHTGIDKIIYSLESYK